ncbi:MAG: ATP-binding protein [Clostridiales bacterium]|nr:ATP-binding protein [Clostridiales bacterium]
MSGPKPKIKIHKLFNTYDIELDLSQRCIIMIGENGIGKSTILKILEALSTFTYDYGELAKHYFEKITVVGRLYSKDDTEKSIKYSDLFISRKEILEALKTATDNQFREWDELTWRGGHYDEDINLITEVLAELDSKKLLHRYLSEANHNIPFSKEIADILKAYPFSTTKSMNEIVKTEKVWKNALRSNDYMGDFPEIQDIIQIMNADYSYTMDGLDHLSFDNTRYFDMTYKYTLKADLIRKSLFGHELLEWYYTPFDKLTQAVPQKLSFSQSISAWFRDNDSSEDRLFGVPNRLHRELKKGSISLLKNIYSSIKNSKYKGADLADTADIIKELLKTDNVPVNEIVNRFYYGPKTIDKINLGALKCYKPFIGKAKCNDDVPEDEKTHIKKRFFSDEVQKDLEYFIRPVLLNHIPLLPDDTFLDELKYEGLRNAIKTKIGEKMRASHRLENNIHGHMKLKIFLEFYDRVFLPVKEKKSEKVAKLQRLLRKYIKNKSIELTPAGIVVTKTNTTQKEKGSLTVHKFDTSIGLDLLSSGEKKLLLIFMICIFGGTKRILIDEPEISLSIIWQEQLLPDLIKETDTQIIVATHSPSIIRDETLDQYIVPLPME